VMLFAQTPGLQFAGGPIKAKRRPQLLRTGQAAQRGEILGREIRGHGNKIASSPHAATRS
jgi:hypothetical protein